VKYADFTASLKYADFTASLKYADFTASLKYADFTASLKALSLSKGKGKVVRLNFPCAPFRAQGG